MTTAHDFNFDGIGGGPLPLQQFAGKVLLIVNVASRCGYTKQYAGLEALARDLAADGVVVIGVPCNQFGAQEPGTEAEIHTFCSTKFGVTFPLTRKVEVKGPGAHPLYRWLTAETGGAAIGWNFEKFVIGKDGRVAKRLGSGATPEGREVRAALAAALAA
ncbi:MAG: glutathione peroxidase [Deltaproteobacteria bacterium]|nr:glutathione peroxidase [Deltaproteobacteria bacterium]